MTTTKYCLVLLLGAVLLSSASLADRNEPHKPPKGEKPPPKHKPPTPLDHDEKSFPEHKPPTSGKELPPKGKGDLPPPEHKPPHEQHPRRHLVESYSLEENSPSLDGKPHKGEKPPSKHKPPTTLDREKKPFPEHKPPSPVDKPPKHEGEKPPPEHKPPHDHHLGHILLESSSLEENSPSLDGKPHKGEKPPPKHKPPTTLDREERPSLEHKPPTTGDKPPKHKGEKPPPEHKPPHDHHPGHILLESSSPEENSPSLDGKPHKGEKPPPKHKPPTTLNREEKPFPEHKPPSPVDKPPKHEGEKPEHKPPHDHHPGHILLESSSSRKTHQVWTANLTKEKSHHRSTSHQPHSTGKRDRP
ncbi:hypothetical protein CJ030_MR0G008628 [Morella rubra]|uniref:Early nodulin-75 n=1 Tax=Morella rubra TaxID=262757 RepID=A0A6A1UIF4_9ROSI|nr:hypothetical protein CJ030_MR0G008628 [Morella rubra]